MTLHDLNQASDALFIWTWKTSLQATVLIAVVLGFQLLFRRWLTPLLRYALGILVLVRLLLPEVPASNFSIFNLKHTWVRPSAEKSLPLISSPDFSPSLSLITREVPMLETERTPVAHQPQWTLTSIAKTLWISGFVALLLRVLRQQRKLSLWIRGQHAITDARLMGLLEDCKRTLKVSRKVRLYKTPELKTPAVFRFWKPCLLVPDDICDRLDNSELKMIFLHELAHIKRGDVLTNWIVIVVRSLHWFNPAVWLAMRRLRADQELVCDARAMAHLGAEERRVYGNTLLKLMIDLSQARLCPSLLPVITNKQDTKRRIIMISQFKPARRATVLLSALIVAAVCSFTFTRAAEKNPSGEASVVTNPAISGDADHEYDPGVKALTEEVRQQESIIREAQKRARDLRGQLGIFDEETLRKLEGVKIESQSMFTRFNTLYNKLSSLSQEELVKALPRAYPDAILSDLLIRKLHAEQELSAILKQYTPEHPDVVRITATIEKVNSQVKDALDGVLSGLKLQLGAAEAQYKEAERMLNKAKPPITESSEDRAVVEKKRREQELANVHEGIRALESEFDRQTARLEKAQAQVDELRRHLNIPNDVAEGNAVSIVDPETIRRMETERVTAQAKYGELTTLLQELQNKDPEELKNAITVVHPDAILTSLLEAQAQSEQKLASLLSDLSLESPEVKKVIALETKIRDQIANRLKGILVGLRAKVSAFKTQADRMAKELDELKRKDMAVLDDYRPYFQAKRDLETVKRMRDILNMKIMQEKVDVNIPRSFVKP